MNLSAVIRQIGLDIKELRQNKADKISPSQTNPVILHKKFNCICPALRQSVTIATGIGFDKYVAISAFVKINNTSYERFANFVYTTQSTNLIVSNEARSSYAGKEMIIWVSYEA